MTSATTWLVHRTSRARHASSPPEDLGLPTRIVATRRRLQALLETVASKVYTTTRSQLRGQLAYVSAAQFSDQTQDKVGSSWLALDSTASIGRRVVAGRGELTSPAKRPRQGTRRRHPQLPTCRASNTRNVSETSAEATAG